MMVNLDLIPRDHKCAVRCHSKEEADEFFNTMVEHYPEKCKAWHSGSQWSEVLNCYNPNFFGNDLGTSCLYYDRNAFYEREGYEIIDFSDLCVCDELHESVQPIELLFGLG